LKPITPVRFEDQIGFTDRLIYVIGTARGGTSFMRSIIGLHPAVVSFDGPTHFLNHVWRHRKRLINRLWRIVFWLPFFSTGEAIRAQLEPAERDAIMQSINLALESGDLRRIYRCYPLLRVVHPESGIDWTTASAWVDKGGDCWGIEELATAFPEGRFVAICRDPRAAIASLSGRLAGSRTGSFSARELRDIVASAIYWCNLTQRLLRFAKRHRARTVLLRYEDLVSMPEATVSALYAALGLPALPELVLEEKLGTLGYGASLDPKDAGRGVSTRPLTRWKTSLDAASLSVIAQICGPVARGLGYSIDAKDDRVGVPGILRLMPSVRAKAVTLAKLLYLRLRTGSALGVLRSGAVGLLGQPQMAADMASPRTEPTSATP
jgi:hypothetical protein